MKKFSVTLLVITSLILFVGCGTDTNTQVNSEKPNKEANHAPVATFDKFTINRDVDYDGQLTASDADKDILKYIIVTQPMHGNVVLHNNGCFTYTPESGYQGTDTFSYRASDDLSSCAVKVVTVDVCKPDILKPNAPTNLTVTVLSATSLKLTWTDNSKNEKEFVIYKDGKPICITKADVTTFTISCGLQPATTYSFEVKAQNEAGTSTATTAQGTTEDIITPVNQAPTPTYTNFTMDEDTTKQDTLTATDADGDALTFAKVSNPTHGTLSIDANGNFTYIPTQDYNGSDSFSYSVSDGEATVTQIVNITITDVAEPDTTPPVITLNGANPITLTVGDTYTELGATANDDRDGVVDVSVSGSVDTTTAGSYTITYTAVDSSGNSAEVTRSVIVQEVANTAVEIIIGSDTTVEDLEVAFNDTDDSIDISYNNLQAGATFSLSVDGDYEFEISDSGVISYIGDVDLSDQTTNLTVTVTNPGEDSVSKTFSVTILNND